MLQNPATKSFEIIIKFLQCSKELYFENVKCHFPLHIKAISSIPATRCRYNCNNTDITFTKTLKHWDSWDKFVKMKMKD